MEGYVSDKEQVEALKRWWKANGKSVILGIVLGIAIVGGGKWWLAQQQSQAEFASEQYEQLLQEVDKGDKDAAVQRGGVLMEKYANSNYAALSAHVLVAAVASAHQLGGMIKTADLHQAHADGEVDAGAEEQQQGQIVFPEQAGDLAGEIREGIDPAFQDGLSTVRVL